MTPLAAFVAAGIAAVGAERLGWLTKGGAGAGFLMGAAVLVGSGVPGGVMLALFLVSGSFLTKWSDNSPPRSGYAGTGGRNWAQVAANGLWAGVSALAIPHAPVFAWSALTGALAAAQADTWATEIGTRATKAPRLITTGNTVPAGTDGGVTALGTGGGVAGAVLMALAAMAGPAPWTAVVSGLIGGIIGMLVDSLLGATIQFQGRRGWRWCTNDVVNFACTGTGAAVAVGLTWTWSLA
jgi:uncharacterized protein (TIGR00297 family)